MLQASYHKYDLIFKRPSGTSRGVMTTKETWFIRLNDADGRSGVGECGLLRGLSYDDRPGYEKQLEAVCANPIHFLTYPEELNEWPSIRFGLEIAAKDLASDREHILFESPFTRGEEAIPINGLIWMGEKQFMFDQIKQKLKEDFRCVKLKIGAIDFKEELALLKYIRSEFSANDIELRVDANGAFAPSDALEKLKRLSDFELHSIEQPIKAAQWEDMAALCRVTPLDIALDEELIGLVDPKKQEEMLDSIRPQHIILKPSLVGGWAQSKRWIDLAQKRDIGWWVTSALESNIGLNAISQWTYKLKSDQYQGLGTGALYTNNIDSPLEVHRGTINYNPNKPWGQAPI